MSQAELLLAIDSEGGTIALYGDTTAATAPRYRLLLLDPGPAVPDIAHSAPAMRRDSGWLPNWSSAMKAVGQS
jgi:hypothetical protein